ncbi:MAG: winged helix DNA-binding domain-containing protein [Actinomycetota bacterium]
MRRFTVEQRRARLGRRHGLVDRVGDPASIADAMVVLHATDPATVYLSALARSAAGTIDDMAHALYRDRSLVRVLVMRRTLFVVPRHLLATVERSSGDDVAATERRRLETFLTDSDIGDPAAWLEAAACEVVEVLGSAEHRGRGLPARKLTVAVPRLGTKLLMGRGTKNSVTAGATSKVLGVLANEGVVMRGEPTTSWTGRTYTWHLRDDWLGGGAASTPPGDGDGADDGVEPDEARERHSARLVERWLGAFGPAPIGDIKWWTGWTVARVKAALARIDTVEVDLGDGEIGLALADDLDDDPEPPPWVALLPSLDPTPMGWKERHWYLGPHQPPLFDRNGNIGPTIWADGRIVGGWGQSPDGAVVTELLEDVGVDHRTLIDGEAARLTDLVAGTVVKPSFPTPLQKKLASPQGPGG